MWMAFNGAVNTNGAWDGWFWLMLVSVSFFGALLSSEINSKSDERKENND